MCAKNPSIFYPSLGNLATHIAITLIPIYSGIFGGIAGALIHGVLILGAHCRSSCTILIWIIFAWMDLVYGVKYLGFFSDRSLKTREKYNSFAQFVYFLEGSVFTFQCFNDKIHNYVGFF